MNTWYLEGYLDQKGLMRQIPIARLPAVLGRDPNADHPIQVQSVSRLHARLSLANNLLTVEDLNSSNGTFVNHRRIEHPTALKHGDVVHLGQAELRVLNANHNGPSSDASEDGSATIVASSIELSDHFPFGVGELEELIDKKQVTALFQPIIHGHDQSLYGMELLGRGTNPELSASPGVLFHIAESVNLATDLSELMRDIGSEAAAKAGVHHKLFVNTHPHELSQPDRLMKSLSELRQRHPTLQIVMEMHEQALADIELLNFFRVELDKLNMMFAFDDFGVGQSRLMELVEAKPNIIKFDLAMIKDIDKAQSDRVSLLKGLKAIADQLGIQCLAECVSTEGEFSVCQTLAFDLYQGYLFGRPTTLDQISF